ncbi:hypothetical protein [Streptomyces iconiensis]|uniref:Uncharacterized protein n=1 Tax=Streptomyces iconiensis TaxID=1384038 RepID=A0ABT7A6U8_9ACTN|nr:hypothetical protein [Streptomyces iconiensis]MDJ1137031.1 hypothetical protein [Streptomyces iconiensis]
MTGPDCPPIWILPYLTDHFGNPASSHSYSQVPVARSSRHGPESPPCRRRPLRRDRLRRLPVAINGLLVPNALGAALVEETVPVSVMAANNETSALQPVKEPGQIHGEEHAP